MNSRAVYYDIKNRAYRRNTNAKIYLNDKMAITGFEERKTQNGGSEISLYWNCEIFTYLNGFTEIIRITN